MRHQNRTTRRQQKTTDNVDLSVAMVMGGITAGFVAQTRENALGKTLHDATAVVPIS